MSDTRRDSEDEESMKSDLVPYRVEEYQIEEIDGEVLLYNAGSAETIYLNEPAAIVWYLCDGERSIGEIAELLDDSYPDAGKSIPSDVEEIVRSFEEHGCISRGADAEKVSGQAAS